MLRFLCGVLWTIAVLTAFRVLVTPFLQMMNGYPPSDVASWWTTMTVAFGSLAAVYAIRECGSAGPGVGR